MSENSIDGNSLEYRMNKASRYATVMADKYLFARQKLAILDPLIGEDIRRLFNNSYGAHAYHTLSLTLMLDLVRDIFAFILDDGKNAPSLNNIFRLLESKDLRTAFRAKVAVPSKARMSFSGERWDDKAKKRWQEKFDKQDVERNGAQFDDAYNRTVVSVPKILGSDRAKKFEIARDKAVAHYEMRPSEEGPQLFNLKEAGLIWNDPRLFLDEVDSTLWDVVLLATWGSYDVEGYRDMHKLYATDFWERLEGRPSTDTQT